MNIKTAECVTPKHPDKMCDQISDAILDAYLKVDPDARVAVETMGGHGQVYITGEITSQADVSEDEIRAIVCRVTGEDYASGNTTINIVKQSQEIANGVDTGGAGDQGIMVGYACNDNEVMIPQELYLARSLAQFVYAYFPYDGKTQITLDEDNKIKTVVASFQGVDTNTLVNKVNE